MPNPSFGNADNGQQITTGNYGQAAYAQQHPDQWRMGANGQYEHRDAASGAWGDPNAVQGGTFGNWFDRLTSGRGDIMGNDTPQEAARKKQEAADAATKGQQDDISAKMDAFIKSMLGPMDQNDPVYRGLMQAGTDAAQRHAGSAGLAGRSTLAGTQSASVAQQNVLPWMQARQQAGAQMLQARSGRDLSLGQLAQGQQTINNGMAESQYNAAQNTGRTWGSLAGGAIGSAFGGPGGGAIGSQLGGAAGGAIAGGAGPAAPQSTWRPGRSLGGTGY